jgi:hypothetical protein
MKKSIFILANLFMLLLTLPIFAQADPGDDPVAPAPIGDYVGALALVGIVFVFFTFRTINKKIIQE